MKKRLKKIIVILCIISLLNNYSVVLAVDVATAGNALASYAYNFYKKGEDGSGAARTKYVCEAGVVNLTTLGTAARAKSYFGEAQNGYYGMDCVGWVSFAIHNCLKIGSNTSFEYFVDPQAGAHAPWFEPVSGALKPGDVLTNSHHVYIYIGKIDNRDTIVHCEGWGGPGGPEKTVSSSWGVQCDYLDVYESKKADNVRTGQYRLTESVAAGIDESQISTEGGLLSSGSVSSVSTENKMSDFYYNGIPDGKYSVTKSWFERVIDSLAGVFDFLVGVLTMWVRMVFVGWTAIIENLVTSTVKNITGGSSIESIPVTSTDIESGDNITIEKIVFNHISVFDTNFFNLNDKVDEKKAEEEIEEKEKEESEESGETIESEEITEW